MLTFEVAAALMNALYIAKFDFEKLGNENQCFHNHGLLQEQQANQLTGKSHPAVAGQPQQTPNLEA